jgi:hypothetical protein
MMSKKCRVNAALFLRNYWKYLYGRDQEGDDRGILIPSRELNARLPVSGGTFESLQMGQSIH